MDNYKLAKCCRYLFLPLFSAFVFVFLLVLLETAFQLNSYLKSENKLNYYYPSFCCGFKLKKNYSNPPIQIDHRGFRKTPFDYSKVPQSKVYKIVAMGDSTTFGRTNEEFFTYPSYLELILNSPRMKMKLPDGKSYIDVINAGIPSYTSDLLKDYLNNFVLEMDPDMVTISIGQMDTPDYQKNSILRSLEKNIPLFYWYVNISASFSYLEKVLSPDFSIKNKMGLNDKEKTVQNLLNDEGKAFGSSQYENNIREIVKILKERDIIPVLIPWPKVSGKDQVKYFTFDEEEIMDKSEILKYKVFGQIMEKISKEFNVPFVRTPFQLPIIPKKHNAKYFMTSGSHLNNYGAKIVGLSLANAISGILEGKSNDGIFLESFASKPDADILDRYVYVVSTLETDLKVRKQKTIETFEKQIADYCLMHTKEDMTIEGYHFSECFFAVADTAFYQMRQKHYISSKHYLDYAVNRYPKWSYPFFIYGLYQFELGNYNEAESHFKKAVKLAPFFKTPQNYLERLQHIEKQ